MLFLEVKVNKYKGFICVIISAIIFGLMPLAAKIIYENGSNALTLTFHRFLFSIPILYILAKKNSNCSMNINKNDLKKITTLSIGYVSTPMLLFTSYYFISSGTATTIHFVYPILVLLFCAIYYKEKISLIKGICCVLCMIGLLFFYTPGNSISFLGIVLAFVSGISYAFYILYLAKSGLFTINTYKVGLYLSIVGSIELLFITVITNTLTFNLNAYAWLLSILFGMITSVAGVMLFQIGTNLIGPQKSSLLSTFEPLTSVVIGIIFFNEQINFYSIFGISCVIISVILLAIFDK